MTGCEVKCIISLLLLEKMYCDLYLTPHIKVNLKRNRDLCVKAKHAKLLEENIGKKNLCNLRGGKDILSSRKH